MSVFERNQILNQIGQPGIKTQQEVDFCRRLSQFATSVLNLPFTNLTSMDVEAKRVQKPIKDITGRPIYEWQVNFVGSIAPAIADFGDDPASEHNAKTIAELLNAVKVFKQSIGA